MKAILLHLYGPIAIQSYGLFIALGVGLSLYFLSKDSKLNSKEEEVFIYIFNKNRLLELL